MEANIIDSVPADAPVLAAFCTKNDCALIASALLRLNEKAAVLEAGGIAEAIAWCSGHAVPGLLFVDISAAEYPVAELADLGAAAGPGCRIVALGIKDDVNLYRSLLLAGAFDYLVAPLTESRVAEVIGRARSDQWLGLPSSESVRVGETIAVTGVAGGAGVSTIAALLGESIAEKLRIETVLVDYDRRKGDLALLLGLTADQGLYGILTASEIDHRLVERSLIAREPEGKKKDERVRLKLLGGRPGRETPVSPDVLLQIGGVLCELFSVSIWDIPQHRPDGSDELLKNADVTVIVLDLTVSNIRSAKLLLAELGDPAPGQRRYLVANAPRGRKRDVLSREQAEKFLGVTIDAVLPCAGSALDESLLAGPVSAAKAPQLQSAIDALARQLLGRPAEKRGGLGLFSRLSGAFGRKG